MLPYGRCDHCDHRLPSTCEQLTLYCCELGNSVTKKKALRSALFFFFQKNNSPRVVYVFLHRCRYTPARTFSPRPFSVRSEAEPLTVAGDWGGSLLVAATVMKVLIGVYGFSLSSPPDQLKQNLKKNSTFRKNSPIRKDSPIRKILSIEENSLLRFSSKSIIYLP